MQWWSKSMYYVHIVCTPLRTSATATVCWSGITNGECVRLRVPRVSLLSPRSLWATVPRAAMVFGFLGAAASSAACAPYSADAAWPTEYESLKGPMSPWMTNRGDNACLSQQNLPQDPSGSSRCRPTWCRAISQRKFQVVEWGHCTGTKWTGE